MYNRSKYHLLYEPVTVWRSSRRSKAARFAFLPIGIVEYHRAAFSVEDDIRAEQSAKKE